MVEIFYGPKLFSNIRWIPLCQNEELITYSLKRIQLEGHKVCTEL